MERFLYRLSRSPFVELFVLKGALLLAAWKAPRSRPTMDIDFAGRTNNSLEHIAEVMAGVCDQPCEPDGIRFLANTIITTRIKEDAEYEGVRVRLEATLARAIIRLQIDIGFGDIMLPAPQPISYPTLLDLPGPFIRAYAKETVNAEWIWLTLRRRARPCAHCSRRWVNCFPKKIGRPRHYRPSSLSRGFGP